MKKTTKINIGDLFVRERTRHIIIVFYISGIHISGQYKLEYRPFEAKRKLSTSFNLFLADKSLHNILHHGSKLGKEFRKKHK